MNNTRPEQGLPVFFTRVLRPGLALALGLGLVLAPGLTACGGPESGDPSSGSGSGSPASSSPTSGSPASGGSSSGGSSSGGSDSGGGSQAPAFTLDVAAFGEKLYAELEFRDQLEELEPAVVYAMLGIDGTDVAAQKNYFSSGATAEEILVLQGTDQDAAGRLKAALEARLSDQQEVYASYDPEEVNYLKSAVLEEKENYLVFCVASDGEAAAGLVNEGLGIG